MTRKRQAVPQLATILGIKFFQLVFSPWFVWDCNFSIYHATIMLTVSTKEKSHQGCLPFTWVKVWEYGKQNFVLVNFVPQSRLPFGQIVSIYRITAAKAWNGIKDDSKEKEREFLSGLFPPRKQDYLFRFSSAPGNFPLEPKNSSSILFPPGFSGNFLFMVNNHNHLQLYHQITWSQQMIWS